MYFCIIHLNLATIFTFYIYIFQNIVYFQLYIFKTLTGNILHR